MGYLTILQNILNLLGYDVWKFLIQQEKYGFFVPGSFCFSNFPSSVTLQLKSWISRSWVIFLQCEWWSKICKWWKHGHFTLPIFTSLLLYFYVQQLIRLQRLVRYLWKTQKPVRILIWDLLQKARYKPIPEPAYGAQHTGQSLVLNLFYMPFLALLPVSSSAMSHVFTIFSSGFIYVA